MWETIIAIFWTAIVASIFRFSNRKETRFDHPIVLLLSPQIIAVGLIPVLAGLGTVIPSVDMKFHHFLYLTTASLLLSAGIAAGALGKTRKRFAQELPLKETSVPFWMTFGIGIFATATLLLNLNITSFAQLYFLAINDFNALESGFFNSSAAILWQANIASFFWYNTVKRPSIFMKVALGFSLIAVFSRGALLYLIIAGFYYLVSYLYLRGRGVLPIKQLVLFLVFVQFVFILSYTFQGNLAEIYIQKTYPYLSGNFVNLWRHIDIAFSPEFATDGFDDITQSLGLGSIRVYLMKYFGFEFQPTERMIFYSQALNAWINGNTHTLYGQLVYLPMFLLFPFLLFLGFLMGFFYRKAPKNLYYISIHCWFSAATFLSFAGAGHFTTTRFFPAMLFIWPFLFVFSASRKQKTTAKLARPVQTRHLNLE
ncbi:hypothetical protein SAMN06265173_108133 [Thalassovita litoralis]|uniref:Uncharacterized protein n=1 Tax=Thalassovita litoralis TaxID=1010611 RepID=A0A521D5D0_9RHOB|nr:hypothetical protein [Thalassovita litoralis]SMO66090.1 hypothetical protein SAMN06265173_108133 [Thalassovita litoralis]